MEHTAYYDLVRTADGFYEARLYEDRNGGQMLTKARAADKKTAKEIFYVCCRDYLVTDLVRIHKTR